MTERTLDAAVALLSARAKHDDSCVECWATREVLDALAASQKEATP